MRHQTYIAVAVAARFAISGAVEPVRVQGQAAQAPATTSPFHPPRDDQAAQPIPLAAEGYCVVTLHDHQEWRLGDRRVGAEFDGREYLFTSPRERAIFAAAPEKYAPVLGGDCIVTFAETGQRLAGHIRYGLMRGGRLYFMASDERLRQFTADPAHYVDADLANGGHCPVTLHNEQRTAAGIPETVATHHGLRYVFASAHQRSAFLLNPDLYVTGGGPSSGIDGSGRVAPLERPARQTESEANRDGVKDERGGEETQLNAVPQMGGYCPVTIRQTGAWVRGRYDYRVEFGPLVFLTAGPAEHDALTRDPVKYLPALGGDCAVSLVDDSERIRGSIFHASEYQDRLFLFADAQRKATFKADPGRYALADVAAGGACIVTQKDDGREVEGTSKYSAWYAGLVYRFAGPTEKKKFVADPQRYAIEAKPAAAVSPAPLAPQSAVAQ